ncbi:hypothetical protein GCM10009740_08560 [Terrabacter terrae]|uniref:Exo-alpha-sialidase n=2 Tax=Terrabacter terrae TaxID=318434 RepID=A0ABN2TVE4_9MICO
MSERALGRLAFGGLLALIVADVLLVALALRPAAADAAAAVPVRVVSASSPSTPAPTPTNTFKVAPVRELIAAADGKRAWRATVGNCRDESATLSVTDDGGRTWTARVAPARALARVQPLAGQRGFVIGAGVACSAGEYDTKNGAQSWTGPKNIDGGWSRVPGGRQPLVVITPGRQDARPCGATPVIDLARVSATRAVVLCGDGRVVGSTDGGSRWSTTTTVNGALSVSARTEDGTPTLYVARVSDECRGIDVAKVSADASVSVACINTSLQNAEGRVSLSIVAAGGWMAIGDARWRSAADLGKWSATA